MLVIMLVRLLVPRARRAPHYLDLRVAQSQHNKHSTLPTSFLIEQ